MKKLSVISGAVLTALMLLPLHAVAEEDVRLDIAPVRTDAVSLQAGARTFVNYCLNCHGAASMRYNRLHDLGLTEAEITGNLMFATQKIGETMKVAMSAQDGKEWFGAAPPDLSVIARSRGADWLYTYLRSFYRDDSRSTNWNNLLFENVGMPNALWELDGENKLTVRHFDKEHDAEAARLTVAFSQLENKSTGKPGEPAVFNLKYVEEGKLGKLSRVDYDRTAADLVSFLVYVGEPGAHQRRLMGILVLFALSVLTFLAYLIKREYWKDIH